MTAVQFSEVDCAVTPPPAWLRNFCVWVDYIEVKVLASLTTFIRRAKLQYRGPGPPPTQGRVPDQMGIHTVTRSLAYAQAVEAKNTRRDHIGRTHMFNGK